MASLSKQGHWKEGVHEIFLHLDEEFKRHFIEAIATLYWSDSTGNTALAAAISQLPQVLEARLEDLDSKLERDRLEQEAAEGALLENERQMDPRTRGMPII